MKTTIAFFDFDSTITVKDSFLYFLFFDSGRVRTALRLVKVLPQMVAAYFSGGAGKAKEVIMAEFFGGMTVGGFNSECAAYAKDVIPGLIRKEAMKKIRWHLSRRHRVVIVSGSPENWIRPWAGRYGIEVSSTRLEVKKGRLTGRFSTKNCTRAEKVKRAAAFLRGPRKNYEIYAYGDSRGDREILAWADHAFYRKF